MDEKYAFLALLFCVYIPAVTIIIGSLSIWLGSRKKND